MTPEATARAADMLAANRLALTPLAGLPDDCRPVDEGAAYGVQDALHARLTAAGRGAVVGHKIGCTTPVMQAMMGIDHPCAGGVFAATVHHGEAGLRRADFVRVGVECEMAVRLAADLPPLAAPFDRARVARAVDACMAAIEIVDDRSTDLRAVHVPTMIADDFFGAGCVLGVPVTAWRDIDLAAATGTMTVGGEEIGRGRGALVMGHPVLALTWLANALARRGRGLRAGDFVLTGSVVETHWIAPGDIVTAAIEGLGTARVAFA